jgi:hypothetical protein
VAPLRRGVGIKKDLLDSALGKELNNVAEDGWIFSPQRNDVAHDTWALEGGFEEAGETDEDALLDGPCLLLIADFDRDHLVGGAKID